MKRLLLVAIMMCAVGLCNALLNSASLEVMESVAATTPPATCAPNPNSGGGGE